MLRFFSISKKPESREDKLRLMWTRIYKAKQEEKRNKETLA